MTNSYATGTTVSVEKTKSTLDSLLAKHGASNRGILSNDEEGFVLIAFIVHGMKYRIQLPLPKMGASIEVGSEMAKWKNWDLGHRNAWLRKHHEQACRERWRAMLLLIKAKLESVAMGISTIEKEFMPDLVLPNGETVNQGLGRTIQLAITSGTFKTLALPESTGK